MSVRYPDHSLIFRNLHQSFPVITHGKGVFLYDEDGKDYLDASSGAFVASLGHGRSDIAKQVELQSEKVAYLNGTQFVSRSSLRLSELLTAEGRRIGLDRCTFLGSGSEAVEAAVKFARQISKIRGQDRFRVISRMPSYHGNTLFALSASGRPHYRTLLGPLLSEVPMVSTPMPFRDPRTAEDYAQELDQAIGKAGDVSAFLLEPISGSSGGGAIPPDGYFEAIQTVCRKHEVLIIADEIFCGVGRAGTFFASEQFQFSPDILVLGKGLSGGYAPLSALMTRTSLVDEVQKAGQSFLHAQTFMQAPCMTAAGVAVIEAFQKEAILENVRLQGDRLMSRLRELEIDSIGNITGSGLLIGLEWTQKGKIPFPRRAQMAEKITRAAREAGLTLWPNVGHIDGTDGDLLMIGPPLTIQEKEVDLLVDRLKAALETVRKS